MISEEDIVNIIKFIPPSNIDASLINANIIPMTINFYKLLYSIFYEFPYY